MIAAEDHRPCGIDIVHNEPYLVTETYQVLRACERMRISPTDWDALRPSLQALLLEYERVRSAEDTRDLILRIKAGG